MGGNESGTGLCFSLLGPVRGWRDGTELPLGPPQQRTMLAVLLIEAGRVVTADRLIDAIWGQAPPDRALGAVRTYAYRLRRLLGQETLVSASGSYTVPADSVHVDMRRCEELTAEALRLRAAGEPRRALDLADEALALSRGDVLLRLHGPYAERQRTRWAERGRELNELRIELRLAAGRHGDVLEELTRLAAEQPLNERFAELRMLALYRAGRQADALVAYTETRRTLAEEVGVDPGPALRELHQRILAGDPALAPAEPPAPVGRRPGAPPEAAAAPAYAPLLTPRHLPFGTGDFVGRQADIASAAAVLRTPGTMPVAALSGLGGVGKTELAVHVAHRVAEDFPDGQLYADLHGDDGRPASPAEVLERFLHAFGVPAHAVPAALVARSDLFRSVLANRRVLLLLDNAQDAEQVRPLLPGTPGCAVLVTSRNRLAALPGARFLGLGVLTPEESSELFTRIVGERRVTAEEEAARQILHLCGHLPLAVRVLASRLACRPSWTVGSMLDRLRNERRRLRVLSDGGLAVEAAFRISYDQLDPAQAEAFRLLALPQLHELRLEVVAHVLGLSRSDAEDLAESLVDFSLLETPGPERYRYHDLVRDFARDLTDADDPVRGRIPGALLDHYNQVMPARPAWADPRDIATLILQCVREVPELDLSVATTLLLNTALTHTSGHVALQLGRAAGTLLDLVLEQGTPPDEARVRLALGRLLVEVGSPTPALAELLRALQLCDRCTLPPFVRAHANATLGMCFTHVGRHQDAADSFRTAASLHHDIGDHEASVLELLNLAQALARGGRVPGARRTADTARALSRALAHSALEAQVATTLGTIAHEQGDHGQAVGHFRAALDLLRPDDHCRTGRTLLSLARSLRAGARPQAAADAAARAADALAAGGDRYGAGLAWAELGHALSDRGGGPDRDAARLYWARAHETLAAIGAPEATSLRELGGLPDAPDRTTPWPSWTPSSPPLAPSADRA
ncbi:AfsR/SARP family transcriptional regulator [Streptomyces olivoreticuli]|uniref:AfsR/SARP family transcriptional regulator n=1 Tax=Streptomyces olivoreticuli TaxID=68246 RepID=UPI000E288FC2|nr:BTAD domain-containing putative transcriptional regulator [Streptomyces olivoreticuli]